MSDTATLQGSSAAANGTFIGKLRLGWLMSSALASGMLLASVATPAVAQTLPTTTAQADADAPEIVVSARKRAEKLNDVPAAVSVFTEQQIEAQGITNPRDFIAETPGVTFVETQNAGTSFVIIRGISQARNSEPSVAVVVDGVQQVNPAQFDQDLFDLEQIEVLKGPQGGLYGRNAIGGAILITTKQPTDTYEYKSKIGFDSGPGITLQQTASGPVQGIDNLKFITSLQFHDTEGYIKNDYLDQSADPLKNTSGRMKLVWKPSTDLSVDAQVSYSRLHTTGFYYNIVSNVNDVSLPVQVNNKGEDLRNLFDASIKVDYDLGFATMSSVTAYDSVEETVTGDAYDFKPIPQSFFNSIFGFDLNQSQYLNVEAVSQDFRLTSHNDGPIHWLAGGYFVHTDRFISTGNMIDTGNGVFPVYHGPSTNPLNPQFSFLADTQDNFAWALYGDVTGEITKQIEIAASLRYDNDDRQNTTNTPTAFLPNIPGFPAGYTGQVRDATFTALQPKVTLRYKPEDNLTLYADWGRGFRSGGFNQTGVGAVAASSGILGVSDEFKAEIANTWEVGGKAELFGRRLLLDGSLYHTTSHNPYFFVFLAANSTQNLGNLNEVVYKGLDFNSSYRITDKLQASFGYAYTSSEITQAADPSQIGNQAPDVSKYTIDTALQYREPITDDLSGMARVDYQRIGPTWWDPANSTVRDPVDLVNARVSVQAESYEVALWSKNLFNKQYNAEFSPGGFVFKALPRIVGLDATFFF